MAIWTEFHPLKKCIVGTLPEADKLIEHTNLTNRYRGYFEHILNKARQELDQLQNILKIKANRACEQQESSQPSPPRAWC